MSCRGTKPGLVPEHTRRALHCNGIKWLAGKWCALQKWRNSPALGFPSLFYSELNKLFGGCCIEIITCSWLLLIVEFKAALSDYVISYVLEQKSSWSRFWWQNNFFVLVSLNVWTLRNGQLMTDDAISGHQSSSAVYIFYCVSCVLFRFEHVSCGWAPNDATHFSFLSFSPSVWNGVSKMGVWCGDCRAANCGPPEISQCHRRLSLALGQSQDWFGELLIWLPWRYITACFNLLSGVIAGWAFLLAGWKKCFVLANALPVTPCMLRYVCLT